MNINKRLIEIRWHGRGGQGVVTGATTLAQAALDEGKHVQAFPEFGPERSGAPIKAYNRISDSPITTHSEVNTPDIVVVMDPTLLWVEDVAEGAKRDTLFVINSAQDPERLAAKVCNESEQTVFAVDASRIALEETGKNVPNTALLGALAKATDLVGPASLLKHVRLELEKKVSAEHLDGNLRAVRRGWCEVREAEAPTRRSPHQSSLAAKPGWQEVPIGAVVTQAGSAREYHTGAWRTMRPVLDPNKCNDCLLCWLFCPDSAILVEHGKMLGFDLDHCKGCGICAEVCPPKIKAITMVPELREAEARS
jgi:pyruvate ferredoxin oxidoreductase gamma subunit